jgi:peptide-methionine (S)-S-oxide reductase
LLITDSVDLASSASEIATFASGCFWGTEHIFLKHYPPAENKGILKTAVGYTGGLESILTPTYKAVCTGSTNHAESVKIEFDPSIVTYDELVGTSWFCVTGALIYFVCRVLLPYT